MTYARCLRLARYALIVAVVCWTAKHLLLVLAAVAGPLP